jgi:hypothetical protein
MIKSLKLYYINITNRMSARGVLKLLYRTNIPNGQRLVNLLKVSHFDLKGNYVDLYMSHQNFFSGNIMRLTFQTNKEAKNDFEMIKEILEQYYSSNFSK